MNSLLSYATCLNLSSTWSKLISYIIFFGHIIQLCVISSAMDYFICKDPEEWDIDAVYDLYKTLNPNNTHEQLIFSIYKALDVLKSLNSPVGAAASNLFRKWSKIKVCCVLSRLFKYTGSKLIKRY